MKFLMFSDLHYVPGSFYGDDLNIARLLVRRAQEENCAFILHAGDLCHGPSHVPELMEILDHSPVPVYHCLGNHDTDETPYEEVLKLYHMPNDYYYFDRDGYRFLVLNPNHCYIDGEYVHYSMKNYFAHGDKRDHTPPEQLEWLEQSIDESPYPCILVSHDSYEREQGSSRDFAAVQRILRAANEKQHNKVLMVMNGHHHKDHIRILDNVIYWDVNSVNYDWIGPPAHQGMYPAELYEKYGYMQYILGYSSPLYAMVTVEGTTITIEGTESTMLHGVTRESIGAELLDAGGRTTTPRIQSMKITLH